MPRCETLANGLRVVLAPCEAESVAVGLFVASGSRHESAKTAGISHLIEHMLFKGTPTRTQLDITRAIEGRGGNFNAATGEESTCYFTHLPNEYLAESLDILSDMYLHATLPEAEFKREKEVVIEEIKMYDDEPDSVAMEKLQQCLFPGSQLGEPVAGSERSLRPLKPADLRRYIRGHYRADNTIVVIVGNFNESEALKLVKRSFGKLRSAKTAMTMSPAIVKPTEGEMSVTREINQAQLALGYRTFGVRDSRKYAASVMDAILGRGMSSRLFQEVREKRGLSYDIASRMQFFADAGMFTITAGLDSSKRTAALKTIDRELTKIATRRVPKAELERTKEFLIGNFRLSHERIIAKLFFYGSTMLSFGRLVSTAEQVEGIRKITSADVLSVAQSIFRPQNRALCWVLPKPKEP